MAGRKENLKSLFSNTRTRVIIIFTGLILFGAVILGLVKFISASNVGSLATANISGVPDGIQSVPGALEPTVQYAKLQEEQNISQAQNALKKGSSAIPTIIRAQTLAAGSGVVGPQQGNGAVGFLTLAREQEGGAQQSLWVQNLKDQYCSKAIVTQVVQEGAQLADLKKGCSCIQLQDVGYELTSLETVCSCKALKAAGFNARQFKSGGYTAGQLRECGFDACELRNAGFTAQEMKDGGFSDGELKGAGFSDEEISRASGLPDGIMANDVRKAGCQLAALEKLRAAGVTASAIRHVSGCSAEQLKAAGYSATDLKNAGFTAAELVKAGFTPAQLRQAGYSARELLNAGFTPEQLVQSGYTPDQIAAAETELPPGITPDEIKNAGCAVEALKKERIAGVSAKLIEQYAHCSTAALKESGFTADDLANAGFTPAQINQLGAVGDAAIRAAGCDPTKLHALFEQGVPALRIHQLNGCSASALKAAGFSAKDLLAAGFTPQDLLAAGFTPDQIKQAQEALDAAIRAAGCDPTKLHALFEQGVSALRIHQLSGCSAAALKAAGFSAKDLLDAGFKPQDLLAAGFTPQDLLAAGFTPDQIKQAQEALDAAIRAAGCDPTQLHALFEQGVSALRIHQLNGCSAAALKAAGFSAKDLLDAGFTPQDLLAAGFTPDQIKQAGQAATSDDAIRAAGCDPTKLHALFEQGVSALRIHQLNGCSAAALKAAGFSAKDLLAAGFTPQDLLAAGFTPQQLVDAGIQSAAIIAAGRPADCSLSLLQTAKAEGVSASTIEKTLGCGAAALKAAGYTAAELKAAGFTAAELKGAGFTANELKAAGYSAKDLKDAGFTAAELKAVGFSAKQLRDARFSPSDLKAAGFTVAELKAAGFNANDLKDAGFTASQLKDGGFTPSDLENAGFSAEQLKNAGFTDNQLKQAGFSDAQIQAADAALGQAPTTGISAGGGNNSQVAGLPGANIPPVNPSTIVPFPSLQQGQANQNTAATDAANSQQLQQILKRQNQQLADQRFQQQIQQRTAQMMGAANQDIQDWSKVTTQTTVGGDEDKDAGQSVLPGVDGAASGGPNSPVVVGAALNQKALIKTGDIIFAVLDTAVNSDQPGPILATVVSGQFKGARLIGSFNLSTNSNAMTINFNTMSVPGAAKSTSINAFAIDPNTARTALASRTNHHYLLRYGSMFASSFLEGFGNAFQSANTTVTIGGTAGGDSVTVQNGIGRSTLENAVIGMATLGKTWGQAAQQQFNTPTTVEVFSGTPMGILFTQDLTSL